MYFSLVIFCFFFIHLYIGGPIQFNENQEKNIFYDISCLLKNRFKNNKRIYCIDNSKLSALNKKPKKLY